MGAGRLHRNYFIAGGIILVTLIALFFQTWSKNESNNDYKLVKKLPFNGQFPVVRLTGTEMITQVGFPPIIPTASNRDYGLFLLMNTLDGKLNCPSCKAFDQEFAAVAAKVSVKQRLEKKVHFATMEYRDNHDLFLRLKVVQVPTLFYLPPTSNIPPSEYPNAVRFYDNRMGPVPASIAAFFERNGKVEFSTSAGPKFGLIVFTLGVVLIVVALIKLYVGLDLIKTLLSLKIAAIACLLFMTVMTSGYMWVRIRGVPYTIYNNQHATFYAGGLQNMLGIESQIVASLNGVAALSLLALLTKIPKLQNQQWRQIGIYSCLLITILSISAEIALFRRKVPAYPFRLLMA